ncbi:MAG: hypothetical protein AAF909_10010, partial [Pseudomonadota bacterium]
MNVQSNIGAAGDARSGEAGGGGAQGFDGWAALTLLKPITWFPPMWAFLCGAVGPERDRQRVDAGLAVTLQRFEV